MNNTEGEGIIYEVHFNQEELCLRLDIQGLGIETNTVLPILTVRFVGCIDIAETRNIFEQTLGKYFYFCSSEAPDGGTNVMMEVDYRAEEFHMVCLSITQTSLDYTEEDLRHKCRWLSVAYQTSQNECLAAKRMQYGLSSGLTKTIDQERERCERKLQFFRQVNSERATEMQGQLIAYERILVRISQLSKPDTEVV